MAQAGSQEVLVVDGDEKVQRGLTQLLRGEGFVTTVVPDPGPARQLLEKKRFAAALIDLDTPTPGAGLDLVRWIKLQTPSTAVVVLVSRRQFDSGVDAFRAGANDVVLKAPDQVEYLRRRVVEASSGRPRAGEDQLFGEVLEVQEEFLRRLMDSARRVGELEAQLSGSEHEETRECSVLVVEDDGWLADRLEDELRTRGGYSLRTAASGGEALDAATAARFQIALVRDLLPDLPGTMVVRTLKSQSPEMITILYSAPGAHPGKAEVIEGSKNLPLLPRFTEARQMVERLDELREAFRRKNRERRYLAVFRQQHFDLLKRYAELKQKLRKYPG